MEEDTIRILFACAFHISCSFSEKYEKTIMRSVVSYVMDQHSDGSEEFKEMVYRCYEKRCGEKYVKDE